MERLQEVARLRSATIKSARRKRLLERKHAFIAKRSRKSENSTENDTESQLRSVFAAIREHTNTDLDFNTNMSPGELFTAVTRALNASTTCNSATETRFVGEALALVEKLNAMLASR